MAMFILMKAITMKIDNIINSVKEMLPFIACGFIALALYWADIDSERTFISALITFLFGMSLSYICVKIWNTL